MPYKLYIYFFLHHSYME